MSTVRRSTVQFVMKAVALALGIAVIVLSLLGTLTVENGMSLLGVGLTALALAQFQK